MNDIIKEAVQIIRDLASKAEPRDQEYGDCGLCYESSYRHDPSCPWLRAVEWVKAHGE